MCLQKKLAAVVSSVGAYVVLPLLVARALWNRTWRESLGERLGFGGWRRLCNSKQNSIWLHAASMGELNGLKPVITYLQNNFSEFPIIVSTTSLSGRAAAAKIPGVVGAYLLPLDAPIIVRRILNLVKPSLLLLVETEIWPNLIFASHSKNVPVLLLNGRISKYSYPWYRRFSYFLKPVFSCFDSIFPQTVVDKSRFLDLGADEIKVVVAGSTKYAQKCEMFSETIKRSLAESLGLAPNSLCFIAGSVREVEDSMVLSAFSIAKKAVPGLQMIIAPRHQERFATVAKLIEEQGLKFTKRSLGEKLSFERPVMLLDTIGELSKIYSVGYCAFVGGTLVDVGGHNPLEPAMYSTAVIVGPYTANVQDAVEQLVAVQAISVSTIAGARELAEELILLASDETERLRRGQLGFKVWQDNSKAMERVVPKLEQILGRYKMQGGVSVSVCDRAVAKCG